MIPALRSDNDRMPAWAGRWAFMLLAAYVLILPIAGTTALRNLLFFSLTALTAWAIARWRAGLYLPFAIPWLLYLAVALFSLLHAVAPRYSVSEIKHEILFGIVATLIASTWIRRIDDFERIALVLVAGSAGMGCWAIGQSIRDWTSNAAFDPARRGALLSGVGDYSTYIIVVVPFLLGLLWRRRHSRCASAAFAIILLLNLVGAVLSHNRAVFPALIAETAVMGFIGLRASGDWKRWRGTAAGGAVFAAVIAALFLYQIVSRSDANPDTDTLNRDPRITIWHSAIDNIRNSPWTGAGFGREVFSHVSPRMLQTSIQFWHAHNVVLNKGVQMGIPGMLAFLLLLMAAARAVWLPRGTGLDDSRAGILSACGIALIVGLLVKNMTDDFFVRDQGYMTWVLLGGLASSLHALGGARAKQ